MEDASAKRPLAYGEGGAPGKKFKLDSITLLLLVPSDLIAGLIGKSGAGINRLEQETGCRLSCSQANDFILGDSLRRVTVTGPSLEQVSGAQRQIIDVLAELESQKTGQPVMKFTVKMLVPSASVAGLIGKKGAGIRNVTDTTGVYLSFCKENEMPVGTQDQRMITLTGSADQVTQAQQMLTDHLSRMLSDGMLDSRSRKPQVDYTQTMRQPQQPSSASNYQDASLLHLSSFLPQTPIMPTGLAAPSSFGSSGFGLDYGNTPPLASATPRLSSASSYSTISKEIESKMYIPNSCVGMVIGARGSAINEVLTLCEHRVYISVGKQEEETKLDFIGNDMLRPVTIRGPADVVFKAQYLIQTKLQENSRSDVNWVVAASVK